MTVTMPMGRVKAMILAAGAGTRARHLTDPTRNRFSMAKPRFPIGQTPIMDHWMMELQRIGVPEAFANLWSNPCTIKNFYAPGSIGDRPNMAVRLHPEGQLLGTMGSAVHWARVEGVRNEDTLFVLSGDIVSNADLGRILSEHVRVGADLTVGFNPVPWSQVKKYGTAAFTGMPEKREKEATETDESYKRYLDGYQAEMDVFFAEKAYQAMPVVKFREKEGPETCCSNLNNASIYVLSGTFVEALEQHGITPVNDKLPHPFYDFGKHGFDFALRQGFKFYGVTLPANAYWMDVGDMGKFWLAIMDTLDGTFDRSKWGLWPHYGEKIAIVHPTAYVHPSAELTPPYYIGEDAQIEAFAKVGPYAVVTSQGLMGRNTSLVGAAMVETARAHEGDIVRQLLGNEVGGAEVTRSLLAAGTVHPDQVALNNVVFIRPDGHQRFAHIGMDKSLSERRVNGERLLAIEV